MSESAAAQNNPDMPDERGMDAPPARREKRFSPFWLTNAVISLHAVHLLIPRAFVPYFPGHLLGPYKVYMLLFCLLCVAWAIEAVRYGVRKPTPAFGVFTLWFWAIFWGGVLHAYIAGDPVKTLVPVYQPLVDAVPYIDGMLVWYLIWNNGWDRSEFESVLKVVFWVVLVVGVECILFFYLAIPNPWSLDIKGRVFISMFPRHIVDPGRLGLILTGVGLYLFLRKRGGWLYLCASLSGVLMLFSTMRRSPLFGLLLGAWLFCAFLLKCRRRSRGKKMRLTRPFRFLAPLVVVLVFSAGALLVSGKVRGGTRAEFAGISSFEHGVKARGFNYTRAADVFLARPFLGGGPRQGVLYAYSADVPPVVTEYFFGDVRQEFQLGGMARFNVLRHDPRSGEVSTIHSTPMNLIADLGLLGLVLLIVMAATGVRYFWDVMLLRPAENSFAVVMPFAAMFCTAVALLISVSSTSKFYPFWLFAILLCFIRYLYREILATSASAAPEG